MDSTRFDDLLRSFALGLSRRATLGAALSSLLATGSLALIDDAAEERPAQAATSLVVFGLHSGEPAGQSRLP